MSPIQTGLPSGVRVVVADANVLYSRCLRNYLLYAAEQGLIAPHWSEQIAVRASSMASATMLRRSGKRCPYRSSVTVADLWPSIC